MAQSSKQKKAAAKARRKQQLGGSSQGSKMAKLMEQNGQLQMSLLNMRQMYDQKVLDENQII